MLTMHPDWPISEATGELRPGEVHVWRVPLDGSDSCYQAALAELPPGEQQAAERYRVQAAQRRFVLSRVVLRRLVGHYLDEQPASVAFEIAPGGKPRLVASMRERLRFNVAHSDQMALLAFAADGEIGVDVERVRRVEHAAEIARRYFHPAEAAWLAASSTTERDARFMQLWTAKEAVLKAVGSGVTDELGELDVSQACAESPSPMRSVQFGGQQVWVQALWPSTGYVGAIASVVQMPTVGCVHYLW